MFEDVVSRRQFITGVTTGSAAASMVNPVLASSANNPVVVSNYPLA